MKFEIWRTVLNINRYRWKVLFCYRVPNSTKRLESLAEVDAAYDLPEGTALLACKMAYEKKRASLKGLQSHVPAPPWMQREGTRENRDYETSVKQTSGRLAVIELSVKLEEYTP